MDMHAQYEVSTVTTLKRLKNNYMKQANVVLLLS